MKKYKYFIYSREQHDERRKIEESAGYSYVPGKVLKTGRWREYTALSNTPYTKYSDAVIICEGYLDEIKYTQETRTKVRR